MRRRELIGALALLGGAAVAWPPAACAQQTMPVVGYLAPTNDGVRMAAFLNGLNETGYFEAATWLSRCARVNTTKFRGWRPISFSAGWP